MGKYGFLETQWEAAKQEAKNILIEYAKDQKMISYSNLSSRIHSVQIEAHDPRLAHMLGEISREESKEGRGMLSVLVVHKYGDQRPGKGFFDLARTLGKKFRNHDEFWSNELKTVLEYWSSVNSMADPVTNYIVTSHAAFEMQRRGISEGILRQVLSFPEQREMVRPGRDVLQSRIEFQAVVYLVRVFVDVDLALPEVVTVYRTSKLSKYWR